MHDATSRGNTLQETGNSSRFRERVPLPHLFLALECDRPWAGGARHDLSQIDEIWIGRGAKRSASRRFVGASRVLELRIPDSRMSHKHARIVRHRGGFTLEDVGSTNGSMVGRSPVTKPVLLSDGELLQIGRTFFWFRAAIATTPGTVADVDSATLASTTQRGFATLLPALAEQNAALEKVALARVPLLLQGETGTGKEVVARSIHEASRRAGPFVAVNCGAIPPTLVEAQLFGHVRGAFSGATQDEPGFLRTATGGTLFLDELGDLPKPAQVTLLRVLQEGEVVPVGSARPQKVDIRVVCATHCDLQGAVERGAFRADLFARIAGLTHKLWPLRERREDLGLLIALLLPSVAEDRSSSVTFTTNAARWLLEHSWPHNVRELQLSLSVAAALAGDGRIDAEHVAAGARPGGEATPDPDERDREKDEELRTRLVEELARAEGNVTKVAQSMGKARMQVQRWLKRLHIDPKPFRTP
jgi:DNA-binding NtrC family response regulator